MISSSRAAYIGGFSVRWIDLGITDDHSSKITGQLS